MRAIAIPVFLLVTLAAPAMAGLFGGGPTTRIPKPAKQFVVSIEDQLGTRVTIASASWDGEVHVWGNLGEGEVSIPFENVVEVVVTPAEDKYRRLILVTTRGAAPVQLEVDFNVPIYGITAYGNYWIELADVRRMTIEASPESP